MKKINVLMIGSDTSVKGGIVSVIKNYLGYNGWKNISIEFIPTHKDGNKLSKILFFIQARSKIKKYLKNNKVDIVHIHVSERGSIDRKNNIINLIKKISPTTKILLHHHGAEFDIYYQKQSIKKKEIINSMLNKVDINIVLSERLVSTITSKAPDANVGVLYNAVNTYDKIMFNNLSNEILFLGRLGERKGTYDLLDVMIRNKNYFMKKNIKFNLCGDGDLDNVKKIVDDNNLGQIVNHVGWINSADKKVIFNNTLINILPSYNEGLPMTILETMAYGIPNISTKIASIPEVIDDEKNGFLIEPGDKNTMFEKICFLIENEKDRKKMSERAYKTICDNFSLDNHVAKLKTFYSNILKK